MFYASAHKALLPMLTAAFVATGLAMTPAMAAQDDRGEASSRAVIGAQNVHWDFQPDRGVVNQQFEQVWAMFPVDRGAKAQPAHSPAQLNMERTAR